MIRKIIHKHLSNPEEFISGFAFLGEILTDLPFQGGIVIGKKPDDTIIDSITGGPTPAYFSHFTAVNKELFRLTWNIATEITGLGFGCAIVEPTVSEETINGEIYRHTLRSPFLHKMTGTMAGLGWIGKTDLIITKQFGPMLPLASLLTDYPPENDQHQ